MEGALDFNVDVAIDESKSMAEHTSITEGTALLLEHVVFFPNSLSLDDDIGRS